VAFLHWLDYFLWALQPIVLNYIMPNPDRETVEIAKLEKLNWPSIC